MKRLCIWTLAGSLILAPALNAAAAGAKDEEKPKAEAGLPIPPEDAAKAAEAAPPPAEGAAEPTPAPTPEATPAPTPAAKAEAAPAAPEPAAEVNSAVPSATKARWTPWIAGIALAVVLGIAVAIAGNKQSGSTDY